MKPPATPIVSVVIPTRNRPQLVIRAVRSALAQTLAQLEVVVVIDGEDVETLRALAAIDDTRVRTISLQTSVGGSDARNIGIRESCGEFIALLDDDDEWNPEKLSKQLGAARAIEPWTPVVTCRLVARRPAGDEIWPARPLRAREPMSEYLLCRRASIRQGEGFIQSSTLFVPRRLMLQVPFTSGLPRHQDWDWLIRVSAHPRVQITWVWEPLVIYHIDSFRKSVSAGRSLDPSIDWVNGNHLVSPRARAYFYATQIAVRCQTPSLFWTVVRNTIGHPRAFLIAMGLALTPRTLVDRLRSRRTLNYA
jgi:glycosyltransferase involved in cell wall biosynthesis